MPGSPHRSLVLAVERVWQLGDGTTTDRPTPVQVRGLADVVAVAAGYWHSLALRADGTVWAWGTQLSELDYGFTTRSPRR